MLERRPGFFSQFDLASSRTPDADICRYPEGQVWVSNSIALHSRRFYGTTLVPQLIDGAAVREHATIRGSSRRNNKGDELLYAI